jgi:hypothetical protein
LERNDDGRSGDAPFDDRMGAHAAIMAAEMALRRRDASRGRGLGRGSESLRDVRQDNDDRRSRHESIRRSASNQKERAHLRETRDRSSLLSI